MKLARLLLAAAWSLAAIPGQELPGSREFLTDYEIDVLRERQDIKQRLEAYSKFAALRLELVEQMLAKPEPGRGAKIHRSLSEYSSIIEAIDDVIDDALLRNRDVSKALGGVLEAEQKLASRLGRIAADPQDDAWRYEFVLQDAIAITQDSAELLAEDLGVRKGKLVLDEEKQRRRNRESMATERRKEAERESRQEAAEEAERESKRPSLLRPGEKLGSRGTGR